MKDNLKVYKKLSGLLYKDMLGIAAEEETKELNSLLQEHKVKGIEPGKIIARLQEKDIFDGMEAYRKFSQSHGRERRLGWWISAAASVILLFIATWWLQQKSGQIENESVVTEMIHPGQSCATVTLADGRLVPLEKDTREWQEQDGTILRTESGGLTYKIRQVNPTMEMVYNTVTIPRGGEYRLELSDGTKVWLNAETELKFPVNFSGRSRDVYLKGEAYFQVNRDKEHEFRVHTSMGTVKVLGTDFNVRDYADEQKVITTLESGKVMYVSDESKKEVILSPGTQVQEDKTGTIKTGKVDIIQYVGWREGKYVFENVPLEEIMQTLGRWYDINVIYIDPATKKLNFSGNLERFENINVFLELIETGGDVKFKTEGKTIIIDKK